MRKVVGIHAVAVGVRVIPGLSRDAIMKRVKRHSLPCSRVARHIQEKLDAGLNAAACREIRKHLDRCTNCTAYLDSLKKVVLLYKRYPDPSVPVRMRERLYAVLDIRPFGSHGR